MNIKYQKLAKIIFDNVGGYSNIINVTHCITRLRFNLKDNSLANTQLLSNTDGIISIMNVGSQYQIIIGTEVSDVYHCVKKILNL